MATYYVDQSIGNDSYPGTETQPWLTIGKATHTMVAGDTTHVKNGTYAGGNDFWYSGSAGNYITLKAYTGHTPVVNAAGSSYGLYAASMNYIEIDGLEVKNSNAKGIDIWNSNYIRILRCNVHDNGSCGIGLAGSSSHHEYVYDCDVHHNGQISAVDGCGIEFYLYGDDSVIDLCRCYNNGTFDYQWAAGIEIQGGNIEVSNCTVYGNRLCGINPCSANCHDVNIHHCIIYGNVSAGIQVDGSGYAVTMHHNIIYGNVTGGGYGGGITISDAGNGNNVYNNTLYGNIGEALPSESAEIQFIRTTSHANIVKNNVTRGNAYRSLFVFDTSTLSEEDYNDWNELDNGKTIYYNGTDYTTLTAYQSASGFSAHSIIGNPLFENEGGADFDLLTGSPCIDTGIDVGYAYQGAAPDMGACEYAEYAPPPPPPPPSGGYSPIGQTQPFSAMGADYELVLRSSAGVTLMAIDKFIALEYARTVNAIGALILTLPDNDVYDLINQVDARIEVWRAPRGGIMRDDMDAVWFVYRVDRTLSENGEKLVVVYAVDAIDLLRRRHVLYNAGHPKARTNTYADDAMKALVRDNMGSTATDTARNLSAYLSVQANFSLAPTVNKAFAWRNVLTVLQEIGQASAQATNPTYLAFDVVWTGASTMEFRTYADWRGMDHRWPTGQNPVLLDPDMGNLKNVRVSFDYSGEATYVQAGGQGEGATRVTKFAKDDVRIGLSPFRRIERFFDARNSDSDNAVQNEANQALREGRPRRSFQATLVQTPGTLYGTHYGFGDIVTANYINTMLHCRIDHVRVVIRNGKEEINTVIRSDELLE